ncbi:T9SS type A sorting domain-containing protein [bacterium]|nr:T9SS type A sorting domain-containing protein [bacterium]
MKLLRSVMLASIFALFTSQDVQSQPVEPLQPDEHTIALWHMDVEEPDSLWMKVIDEDDVISHIYSLIRADDDNLLVCGYQNDDVALANMNEDGEVNWCRTFDFGMRDRGINLIQCSNGNIAMVCSSYDPDDPNNTDYWVFITENDGDSITAFTDENLNFSSCTEIVEAENDGIILGGMSDSLKVLVVKFDIDGNLVWSFEEGEYPSIAWCEDILKSGEEYLICGLIGWQSRGFIISLDEDGEVNWSRQYGNDARINSILQDDEVFICAGEDRDNYWVFAIDKVGNQLWSINTGSEHIDVCQEIIHTMDDNYLIVGIYDYYLEEHDRIGGDIGMMKVSPEGEIIWQKTFGGEDTEHAWNVVALDDRSYLVSGSSDDNENYESILFRTTPDLDITTDVSSYSNNGILYGEAEQIEGLWDGGLNLLSESGGCMSIPDDESLRPEQFTIEGWFYIPIGMDEHTGAIINKVLDVEYQSYLLYVSNEFDEIGFLISTEENEFLVRFDTAPDDGEWHHIAGIYNGSEMKLYYDGVVRAEREVDEAVFYDDCELIIGSNDRDRIGDYQFYGIIDEVRISDIERVFHSIENPDRNTVPSIFCLLPPYPNPFNSTTNIKYTLDRDVFMTLKLYDLSGREIANLVNKRQSAGNYQTIWNAEASPSGVYLLRLTAGKLERTAKLLLIR